ncbi:hypothetical protein [Nocardioides ochotonae]|uniref:hypothetical protein n=1 Tax=Nocardioides ochotonae TaxID=2685869 RepID=UPI001407DC1E|nr:hypothetical protein [Nocardioides ochotonae]
MNPKLTDEAVASLPLSRGRADLLEEIVSTPLRERTEPSVVRARRTRWVAPLVAATVAALALVPLWWGGGGDGTGGLAGTAAGQRTGHEPVAAESYRVVLDAPGWTLVTSAVEEASAELTYERGTQVVSVMWGEADSYEDYLFDREHITDPRSPGEPIVVLGLESRLWAYGATDHTVLRPVQHGHWAEVRGSGMDREVYEGLLTRLRQVDLAGFEAVLSGEAVTSAERAEAIAEILDAIRSVADPALPPGLDPASITSEQVDPYHLGVDVAGAVACAWLGEYRAARRAGQDERAATAVTALGTSRDWPVLVEMRDEGDYAEVVWQFADDVAEGRLPRYREALGCPR